MNKPSSGRFVFLNCSLYIMAALLAAAFLFPSCDSYCITVPPGELEKIGSLIYRNECGGKVENLTAWNEGEEFSSLGIGHFLWYPEGKEYPFYESFPSLFGFIKLKGAPVPEWMNELPTFDLPWNSRSEFYNDFDSPRMASLRKLMVDTVMLQTLFIAERLEKSLPGILRTAPAQSRSNISKQFYRVAGSPMGMYVLVDYVNFKGEGTSPKERYKGEGWGLLQVLENMRGDEAGPAALREFAQSAEAVLERRVRNSPPTRNEEKFLPGWRNRIKTYGPENIDSYEGGLKYEEERGESPVDYVAGMYRKLFCGSN